jgi:hypothetical protein
MSEPAISTWYRTPLGQLVARSEPPGRPRPSVREAVIRSLAARRPD